MRYSEAGEFTIYGGYVQHRTFPSILPEERKAMEASKNKVLAVYKTIATNASSLEHNNRGQSKVQTSRELPRPKRKAEELSISD
jgi:hypothetical protein